VKDPAEYQRQCLQFFDEYQPATPTENQLTQELADTAWRLNRIPQLEAALLDRAANPPTEQAAIGFDIVDAHRALGMHGQWLSRQFKKPLTNSAKSNPSGVASNSANSSKPQPSSNSINIQAFPMTPPSFFQQVGPFFQSTKSKLSRNA
jgi:hypothetical protein